MLKRDEELNQRGTTAENFYKAAISEAEGRYNIVDWNDRVEYAMYVGMVMMEEAGYTNISYNIKNTNIGFGNWGEGYGDPAKHYCMVTGQDENGNTVTEYFDFRMEGKVVTVMWKNDKFEGVQVDDSSTYKGIINSNDFYAKYVQGQKVSPEELANARAAVEEANRIKAEADAAAKKAADAAAAADQAAADATAKQAAAEKAAKDADAAATAAAEAQKKAEDAKKAASDALKDLEKLQASSIKDAGKLQEALEAAKKKVAETEKAARDAEEAAKAAQKAAKEAEEASKKADVLRRSS